MILDNRKNFIAPFFLTLGSIVLLQWGHFVWYFEQPVGLALLWSVVDWSVWFCLFAVYWRLSNQFFSNNHVSQQHLLTLLFIMLAGPMQILISSGAYQLLYQTEKTLLESFFHLMNKRWLQNLMISSCAVLVFRLIQSSQKQSHHSETEEPVQIKVYDGKNYRMLETGEIYAICSTKNYLSLYTKDEEVVIRETLKEFKDKIPSDDFIQVSRSAVVNIKVINQLSKYSKSSFQLILANNMSINVSRRYLDLVKSYFTDQTVVP
jgi:hypothetical protein